MYTHALALCQHLEEPQQLFPVLRGLWQYYHARTDFRTAHALGEQLLTLAQQAQDSAMLMAAHAALGRTLYFIGAFTSAHTHLAQGIALYDPQQHRASTFLYGEDTGVICHSFAAFTLWHLGYPDQGLTRSQEVVTLAQQSAHPYSLGFALNAAAIFHQCRREERAVQERAEAIISLSKEQGFPFLMVMGSFLHGWALVQQGQTQEGIEQSHLGWTTYYGDTAQELYRPYFLTLFADAHGIMGEPKAGLSVLTEALALVDKTGERWCEAELYRLKGALLLQQSLDNQVEAESCFA